MPLTLYNTLTRTRETFEPRDSERVTMYVCGPTVYNFIHIGNARPIVVFDVLYRLLRNVWPRVVYARNITDVDDKINAAAQANGESIGALTARFTEAFHTDVAALNTLPPDVEPRATDRTARAVLGGLGVLCLGVAAGALLFLGDTGPVLALVTGGLGLLFLAGAAVAA